jgi:hypothetical protein
LPLWKLKKIQIIFKFKLLGFKLQFEIYLVTTKPLVVPENLRKLIQILMTHTVYTMHVRGQVAPSMLSSWQLTCLDCHMAIDIPVLVRSSSTLGKRWAEIGIQIRDTKSRPRTYPFFEDIYHIPYHGQKSDIISYPLSRQKKDRILYPILSFPIFF